MKRVLFFPYHPDIKTIFRYRQFLQDYEITGVISYKEDIQVITQLNLEVDAASKTYEQLLQECDIIILLENYRNYQIHKYYEVIDDAIARNIEIFAMPLIETCLTKEEYIRHIKSISELGKLQLPPQLLHEAFHVFNFNMELQNIEIPIVGIFGMGKNCGKFEMQIMAKFSVENKYSAAVVCTNSLGILFGFNVFPTYLYEKHSFQDKIIVINYYIKWLIKKLRPDFVILGVPEGVAPYYKIEMNHFAEFPFVLSNAVTIDMAILNLYFSPNVISEKEASKMLNILECKFNTLFGAVAISKVMFELTRDGSDEIIYEHLEDTYLESYYPMLHDVSNLRVINMFDEMEGMKAICEYIQSLEKNAQTV